MRPLFLGAALLLGLAYSACVPSRQYNEAVDAQRALQADYDALNMRMKAANAQLDSLEKAFGKAKEREAELQDDLARANERYATLDKANRDLLERYDRILAQNDQMLSSSSAEKSELREALAAQRAELDAKEKSLKSLEATLKQRESELAARIDTLERNLQGREKRVGELEAAIAAQEAQMASITKKVQDALLGFSASDLSVTVREGKLYVSLSQNLLFKSGSKTIDKKGREAIEKVAEVLKANPELSIMVEGHTDSDGDAGLNWDLSVGRATSVVKILSEAGVDPQRISAAGRGEHAPIAPNDTAAGKAQNRRTDIVITPKLDALMGLIKAN